MSDKKRKARDEVKKKSRAGRFIRNVGESKKSVPRLPNAIRREVITLNPNSGEEDGVVAGDVYEYEEEVAEEESKKNRRYDRVRNYEYELPEDFEDEDVLSDDEDDFKDTEGRHSRLLQQVTGMPAQVFQSRKWKNNFVVYEAYPESEYNPTIDVLAGKGNLSIQDLLVPLKDLHGPRRYSNLKKKLERVDKKMPLQAPLPKPEQEKIQRAVGYDYSKKEVTKWEPLVKRNREAPTICIDKNLDLGFSTLGAIASEFKPRTDFEKKIDSLVNADEVVEAERKDGFKFPKFIQTTAEEVNDSQNRQAKLRSFHFHHKVKAKRIKKCTSKTHRRLLKKERLKAAFLDMQTDPEAFKKLVLKQEIERVKERASLKHTNHSRWGKNEVGRGHVQNEGKRAASQEMRHKHQSLTRKGNSMNSSSDRDDDDLDGSDIEDASKLKLDNIPDLCNSRSDSEDEHDTDEDLNAEHVGRKHMPAPDANVDLNVLHEDLETADDSLFKTMDDIAKQHREKTAYDVATFTSGSWKKIPDGGKVIASTYSRDSNKEAGEPGEEPNEDPDENGDLESEGQMIDGILSSGTLEKYKLPSQEELIRRAFAGDDVEEEFERTKEEALNEENPKPEEPALMPGWGQWASVKKKRGVPSWMREELENAKKVREEALKRRKDAKLKHVIISENVDKKAEKLHIKALPYPFTSHEVFEQSIRMPIGPEFNPATTLRAISRPEVVKRPGVIIKPISYEEVNPHEDDQKNQKTGGKQKRQRPKAK